MGASTRLERITDVVEHREPRRLDHPGHGRRALPVRAGCLRRHVGGGHGVKLEKRAAFGWPASAAGYAPCRNGLVVHYDGSDQGLAGKSHSACRTYWRNTRKFHMNSRGWADIGYAFSC